MARTVNTIDHGEEDCRRIGWGTDSGSAAVRVAWVLGVITLAFAIFVGLKYFMPADDEPSPSPTDTPSSPSATTSPAVTPSPPPPPVASFAGTWTGNVTGDLHTYTIDVVIVDNGSALSGDVTYTWNPPRPGVDECVGEWTQVGRHDKHVDVREVITSGDACIDETDITLDLKPNGTIAFAVFYSDEYHPKATLSRDI